MEERRRANQETFAKVMVDVDKTMDLDPDFKKPWVDNTVLEETIRETMLAGGATRPGVAVLFAPQGAGKSTRVKCCARKLVKDERLLRGAVYISCRGMNDDMPIATQAASKLGIELDPLDTLSDLVPPVTGKEEDEVKAGRSVRKVAFIFDQVEELCSHPRVERFFTSLALASHNASPRCGFFVVALCSENPARDVSDIQMAVRLLLLNGGTKLYPAAAGQGLLKCRFPDLRAGYLFQARFNLERQKLADEGKVEVEFDGSRELELWGLCAKAGTAAFCRWAAHEAAQAAFGLRDWSEMMDELTTNAEYKAAQWRHCMEFALCACKMRSKRQTEYYERIAKLT